MRQSGQAIRCNIYFHISRIIEIFGVVKCKAQASWSFDTEYSLALRVGGQFVLLFAL